MCYDGGGGDDDDDKDGDGNDDGIHTNALTKDQPYTGVNCTRNFNALANLTQFLLSWHCSVVGDFGLPVANVCT